MLSRSEQPEHAVPPIDYLDPDGPLVMAQPLDDRPTEEDGGEGPRRSSDRLPRPGRTLRAMFAVGMSLMLLLALGANPITAYGALIEGAFGSGNSLAETAAKAVPLLLVGLGICIAFRGGQHGR